MCLFVCLTETNGLRRNPVPQILWAQSGIMNLTELLDNTVARWPQKPALIEESTAVSYAELVQQINELTGKLQSLPIAGGSRIGLAFPNGISYVALTFALWRVNAVVVPIPTECTAEEVAEIADALQLQAVLSPKAQEHSVTLSPECFFTKLNPVSPPDNHGLNLAFIRFTSGTIPRVVSDGVIRGRRSVTR